jgi:hypothetical protein
LPPPQFPKVTTGAPNSHRHAVPIIAR